MREKRVRVGRKAFRPAQGRNVGLRMPRHTSHGRRETPCPIREQYGELRMSGNAQTAGHSPELLLSDDIVQLRMPRHTGCARGPEQCSSLSYISLRHIGIKVIANNPHSVAAVSVSGCRTWLLRLHGVMRTRSNKAPQCGLCGARMKKNSHNRLQHQSEAPKAITLVLIYRKVSCSNHLHITNASRRHPASATTKSLTFTIF